MSNIEKEIENRISRRLLAVFVVGFLGIALATTSAALSIFAARDEAVDEIRQERMDTLQAIERARLPANLPIRNDTAPDEDGLNFL